MKKLSFFHTPDLILLGREDPSRTGERLPVEDLPPRPGEGYLLSIEHTPYQTDDTIAQRADLQLSGHTHAGQLLPMKLCYAIAGLNVHGLYHIGETDVYISSEISGWAVPLRTEAHCNFEVVTIKPGEAA